MATPAAAQERTPDLRQAVKSLRFDTTASRESPAARRGQLSGVQRGILTAIAGVGGFFAGGYIGAKIEGPCDCDDPGFMGAIIGAPVGAATAAVVTWILTGRD